MVPLVAVNITMMLCSSEAATCCANMVSIAVRNFRVITWNPLRFIYLDKDGDGEVPAVRKDLFEVLDQFGNYTKVGGPKCRPQNTRIVLIRTLKNLP